MLSGTLADASVGTHSAEHVKTRSAYGSISSASAPSDAVRRSPGRRVSEGPLNSSQPRGNRIELAIDGVDEPRAVHYGGADGHRVRRRADGFELHLWQQSEGYGEAPDLGGVRLVEEQAALRQAERVEFGQGVSERLQYVRRRRKSRRDAKLRIPPEAVLRVRRVDPEDAPRRACRT